MAVGPARKLAVILHADVVGSTSLVQKHETLAHERIQETFRRLSKTIDSYGGITHELRGDALVAEFGRVSDAVCAAVAFQRENIEAKDVSVDDLRPRLRIGIAMGEVVIADNTVTGEGVVLAQRLEQIAEPDGACLQGAAYETIPKRLPFAYESLGEQRLKGFADSVRSYRVRLKEGEVVPSPESTHSDSPAREFSGKPSIAVLPFTNMSGDPEQEYFSDGITEDIITVLSTSTDLLVIARHSSFSYKGKSVTVLEVAQDLAVRYVLEGSVRKVGNQVRITVQLIDGMTGHHVWADRYDQTGSDVFAIQDEVTAKVLASIGGIRGHISQDATRKAWAKDAPNLEEYDYFLRGLSLHFRFTKGENARARQIFEEGLVIFPGSSLLRVMLAWNYREDVLFRWSGERDLGRSYELAQQVLADERAPLRAQWLGHWLMAFHCVDYKRDFDRALAEREAALALIPGGYAALGDLSYVLCCAGMPDEAIASLEEAMRADPTLPQYSYHLGRAKYIKGQYQEAVEQLEKTPWPGEPFRAASYAQLGLTDKARAEVEEILNNDPETSISTLCEFLSFKNAADLEHVLDGLRKAELPE